MQAERDQGREVLLRDFHRFVCQTSSRPLGLVVERAHGACVWDRNGRRYLDLLSGMGVANIGHAHPEVAAAVCRQAQRYPHAMVYGEYVLEPQVALARRLASLLPSPLSVVYFTSSGAEAVEGALKLARKATGRARFVAFAGAFHGDTLGALSVGGNPLYRDPFEPLLPGVEWLPFGEVTALEGIDERVAAVIVEPVQAEAGVRIPPADFLPALARRCREAGALLIFDEVVTGFGRTGRRFAFEHWDTAPDVLVLAKALGGGLPLGAFVSRAELMATLSHNPPLAHVTTFGGNPVSCAAGLAALEVLEREELATRAARVGAHMLARLQTVAAGEPAVRAVRGIGLLLAVEFVRPELCARFCQECMERGLVVGWTLQDDTVVRLAPPLVIADDEVEAALSGLAAALRACRRG